MNNDLRAKVGVGISILVSLTLFMIVASAQTPQFSYQGSMNSGGIPANGSFDFEFRLFDAVSGGTQVGTTVSKGVVTVSNGTFSVILDFQGTSFPGGDRFLEISVRPTGNGAYTTLTPRSQILSSPYSIASSTSGVATNALNLNGVAASQFVQTNDSRLSDARPPAAGSSNYIQNNSGSPQANANLSIDGMATATQLKAWQYYYLGNQRILFGSGSSGSMDSVFLGPDIALNSSGVNNTFMGVNAGTQNTTGAANSFFGRFAGNNTTTGQSNSFFGTGAGGGNQAGSFNVYVGQGAGNSAPAGSANTFIGTGAGASINGGSNSNNVAIGADAGNVGNLGSNNTFVGKGAISNQPNLSFATAIGSGAVVGTSNTVVIGRSTDTVYVPGPLQVTGSGVGTIAVCATATGVLAQCSSSKRYKSDVESYLGGLNVVRKLRPVSFVWNQEHTKDLGFIAEEVNSVEPRLSLVSKEGTVEGVKYAQVTTVLVNAVKEQQKQIESQQAAIDKLQAEINSLKASVRSSRRRVHRTK